MIDFFTLENGIRVVVKRIDGVKSCSVGIFVKAGSVDETAKENGVSHFIEHTNFKGTEKRTAFDISWDSEALGIVLNAATAKEYTYYYAKTTSEHTAKAFDILADLFINSVYPADELDKERGVVIEEINMYEDTPDDVCTTELAAAYYGRGQGLGRAILGTKKNVGRFSREDILSYKQKYYATDNIVLSFVGDVDASLAKSLSEDYFGPIPKTKAKKRVFDGAKPVFGKSERFKDIEQAHLALAFEAVGLKDELSYRFDVIANVLGGGMSSRLFQKIREQMGLCYTVYSYYSSYVDAGALTVYAGLGGDRLRDAYNAVFDELRSFKKQGATEAEFDLVKQQLKSALVFAEESTTAQMTLYGKRMLLFNEIYDFDAKLDKINSLSLSDVNDCVRELFNVDKFAVSTVGKSPIIDL